MTQRIEVPEGGGGLVHVFALDLTGDAARAFVAQPDGDGWPLKVALGATVLDRDQVEHFPVSDLAGMGLYAYLVEGMGIDEAAADRTRIDAVTGDVVVLRPMAFAGAPQVLNVAAPLRHVGSFPEVAPERTMEPLRSDAAQGSLGIEITPGPAPTSRLVKIAAAVAAALFVIGVLALATGGGGE
jgi:hypothetical protein